MTPAPALDLTTSLRGDSPFCPFPPPPVSFFFYEAAIVLQQYEIILGSKYTLSTLPFPFPFPFPFPQDVVPTQPPDCPCLHCSASGPHGGGHWPPPSATCIPSASDQTNNVEPRNARHWLLLGKKPPGGGGGGMILTCEGAGGGAAARGGMFLCSARGGAAAGGGGVAGTRSFALSRLWETRVPLPLVVKDDFQSCNIVFNWAHTANSGFQRTWVPAAA